MLGTLFRTPDAGQIIYKCQGRYEDFFHDQYNAAMELCDLVNYSDRVCLLLLVFMIDVEANVDKSSDKVRPRLA